MIDLTEQQIADAKSNNLDAITAVVKATEDRIQQLARQYATTGGRLNIDLAEELAQIGRIAVWESLSRFGGTCVAQYFTFVDTTLRGVMANERRTSTRQGVSEATAHRFEHALTLAGGDPYEAERVAQDRKAMGGEFRILSAEMAHAARLSWQGVEYLDGPMSGDESITLGETIASHISLPDDLIEAADIISLRKREIRNRVRATLARMGEQRRYVLGGTFGIHPYPYYGAENDAEMADDMGIPERQIRTIRWHAKDSFRKAWLRGAHVEADAA